MKTKQSSTFSFALKCERKDKEGNEYYKKCKRDLGRMTSKFTFEHLNYHQQLSGRLGHYLKFAQA